MKNYMGLVVIGLVVASSAFASGFKCEGDSGYRVKLYNHRNTETRVPAKMIISHEDAGTLLVADESEISKTNRANTVRYTVDGNRKIQAEQAILQIAFKEGRETLGKGKTAEGQLILVGDEDREVFDLTCVRYLVGE